MGLLRKFFGGEGGAEARETRGPLSSQFHETDPAGDEEQHARNAPRRELVQVMLRDAMRRHGIPSDWIEARVLSTISRGGRAGLHVNFVVKEGHEQMLGYVFAFQESFETELKRIDPRARDWLLSIGGEFHGVRAAAVLPHPGSIKETSLSAAGRAAAPALAAAPAPASDDDLQRDLQALFAIRDAALADAASKAPSTRQGPDFEATRPLD